MATPIEYTSQFIPTNVGLMNQQLGQMQQRYDQAASNVAQTVDKYGQMLVDPSDIQAKQAVLGGIESNFQDIVDKYGGDYGAAAKDLTRSISKSRQNPFFQLAPYKRSEAERERRRIEQLGPRAIVTKSIADSQLYDPDTGKYATMEDLQSEVLDRKILEDEFSRQYGKLGDDYYEYKLKEGRFPGYHTIATRQGLDPNRVDEVTQDSFSYIKSLNPNIPDDAAMDIASNMTKGLIKGTSYKDIRDLSYDTSKKDSQGNVPRNYIITRGDTAETGWTPTKSSENVQRYSDAVANLNANKESLDSYNAKIKARHAASKKTDAPINKMSIVDRKEQEIVNANYQRAEREYNKALSEFKGDMFDDLTSNYGYSESDAVNIIAGERAYGPMGSPSEFVPSSDKSKEGILSDLKRSLSGVKKISGVKMRKRDSSKWEGEGLLSRYDDNMKDAIYDGNIIDYKVNLKDATISLISKDGDSYKADLSALGNKGTEKNVDAYKKLINVMYGDKTDISDPVIINGMEFVSQKLFNSEYIDPNTGENSPKYETNVYLLDRNNNIKTKVSEEWLNDMFASSLFGSYGQTPQYKPTYINK